MKIKSERNRYVNEGLCLLGCYVFLTRLLVNMV
jgi:hypothetical protein